MLIISIIHIIAIDKMPIHRGKDSKGPYYQFGYGRGAKFYYKPNDKQSRDRAYKRCLKQMGAMFANGYRGR
jgi:hypothetical protein